MPDSTPDPLARARTFVHLADTAAAIAASDAPWTTKYNLIFTDEISCAMRSTGLMPEYCDPDSSAEDDVRALVRAAETRADELRPVLQAVPVPVALADQVLALSEEEQVQVLDAIFMRTVRPRRRAG